MDKIIEKLEELILKALEENKIEKAQILNSMRAEAAHIKNMEK